MVCGSNATSSLFMPTLRKRSTMIASFFAGVYIFRIIRNDLLKNFLGRGMEEQVLPRFQNP